MKIGAVIPTLYNRGELLDFTYDRMVRQTLPLSYIEIIPSDGQEVDITKKYVKGLDKLFDKGCDLVFLIEDDDYYPLDYVERMSEEWLAQRKPSIMGLSKTIYYHVVANKYHIFDNISHCAAFTTLVSKEAKYFGLCKDNYPYYDVRLWQNNLGVFTTLDNNPIGIKHGIGKTGGNMHDPSRMRLDDNDLTIFNKIFDEDARTFYKGFLPR